MRVLVREHHSVDLGCWMRVGVGLVISGGYNGIRTYFCTIWGLNFETSLIDDGAFTGWYL